MHLVTATLQGQRIANYTIEFQRPSSSVWETIVPPVWATKGGGLRDRPDGQDPRDSHIGHKRIDTPVVATHGPGAVAIGRIRFVCIRALEEPVYIRSLSIHKRSVPWE